MTQQHPITPPPELVQQWIAEGCHQDYCTVTEYVAHHAAQWGADQELEACCEWIADWYGHGCNEVIGNLRTSRRPKPPSLKKQALKELAWVDEHLDMPLHNHCNAIHAIRRALEQLPDSE
jgi:hypothetical protein